MTEVMTSPAPSVDPQPPTQRRSAGISPAWLLVVLLLAIVSCVAVAECSAHSSFQKGVRSTGAQTVWGKYTYYWPDTHRMQVLLDSGEYVYLSVDPQCLPVKDVPYGAQLDVYYESPGGNKRVFGIRNYTDPTHPTPICLNY